MKKEEKLEGNQQQIKLYVDRNQSPVRIDKFVLDHLEKVSRSRIQNSIKDGLILVNSKEIKANYKVRPLDVITVFLNKPEGFENRHAPEDIPLDIRYEDDQVMIIHKPPGMVVHPGIGNYSGTLVNALLYYFRNSDLPLKDPEFSDRPGIVHRIDKDTSGLMVIAKTPEAMTHLGQQFYDHTVQREYVALVWGDVEEDKGTIDEFIGRHEKNRMQYTVFPERDQGKHAITHYEVVERMYYVTLVKCRLETGRTHQIRVHMKYLGHPLFSDARYGGDKIMKGTIYTKYKQFVDNAFKLLPRQALHARLIGFEHPTTGEEILLESELPEDFQACLDKWRGYISSRKNLG
ncbi:MAG: RluA family pseudouridine synthase [Bacteroidota bacterium]